MNPFKAKPRLGGNCSSIVAMGHPSIASYIKNKVEVKDTISFQFPPSNETVTTGVESYLGENSSDTESDTLTIGSSEEASTNTETDGMKISKTTMTQVRLTTERNNDSTPAPGGSETMTLGPSEEASTRGRTGRMNISAPTMIKVRLATE